jgi:hypothetical protein
MIPADGAPIGGLATGRPLDAPLSCLNTVARVPSSRPGRVPANHGDMPFLIKRDGTWMYQGTPINRKELVCLFASVLRRDADGGWWLRTPAEHGRIEVEDAPFVAVELDWTCTGSTQILSFRTNVDQVITAGPDHPIRIAHDPLSDEPTPYILVRPGDGEFPIEARINRATYYELVAIAEAEWIDGRQMLGVWSRGHFFPLGDLPEEDGGGDWDPGDDLEASDT